MPAMKVHLEQAELDAVTRLAGSFNVKPEALLYAALNRLMLDARKPNLQIEVMEAWEAHYYSLPLWSDSAWSPHAYEGQSDDEPSASRLVP